MCIRDSVSTDSLSHVHAGDGGTNMTETIYTIVTVDISIFNNFYMTYEVFSLAVEFMMCIIVMNVMC